ncbi:hypothetical protein EBU71_11210 [bacterium]|nr:hypothetical protein [Candidatus Elulimicrobium humile]
MSLTNLPVESDNKKKEVREFFNTYFDTPVNFPSNQIDAVIGFFVKRGFDEQVARSTSIVLLNQSRIDQINVFELLDKLKNVSNIQLGQIMTQVMNGYRIQTSVLGFKTAKKAESFESRNILI